MVQIDDQRYGPGAGRNKKEAEQNAAAMAFAALKGPGAGPASLTAYSLSFPKSRVVRRGLVGGHHRPPDRRRSRCCIPGRSAGTWPGVGRLSGPQLIGRTFDEPRRRGKYLWLPFTDGDACWPTWG